MIWLGEKNCVGAAPVEAKPARAESSIVGSGSDGVVGCGSDGVVGCGSDVGVGCGSDVGVGCGSVFDGEVGSREGSDMRPTWLGFCPQPNTETRSTEN
jgi:hypothetical protein